jgi:hypothetical protein
VICEDDVSAGLCGGFFAAGAFRWMLTVSIGMEPLCFRVNPCYVFESLDV